LREAVTVHRAAQAGIPVDHPDRAGYLSSLGYTLRLLSGRTGDLDLLREAVTVGRAAIAGTADDDHGRVGPMVTLGGALHDLFERTGELDALREAVAVQRAALAAVPDDQDKRATCLSNLGNTLRVMFGRTGDLEVLREAVTLQRAAMAAAPGRDAGLSRGSNLAASLQALFEHTGDLDALREAVTIGRTVVAAAPTGHPRQAVALANLGVTLRTLFEETGDLDLLREAVTAHRACVAATPDEHPNRANRLTNLGNTLNTLFRRTEELPDLVDAIGAGIGAIDAAGEDHPDRGIYAANLMGYLFSLFVRNGDTEVLHDVISLGRDALAATPDDHPVRPRYLANLARALFLLADRTDDMEGLREAVETARTAADDTPDGHPELSERLAALGTALRRSYERTGDPAELAEARTVLDRAMRLSTATVVARVRAGSAKAAADALGQDYLPALAAMESVLDLLPMVAAKDLRRADREHRLGEVAGIAERAAAIALSADRPDRAVELLERARGLLLAETMEGRTDHARLQAHAPDLADRFAELRDWLVALQNDSAPGVDAHALAEQRQEAAGRWKALMEKIRDRPGLADFLTPPSIAQLHRHAASGPIVIVNTDAGRCDALIVTDEANRPVRHVPLPDLTHQVAYELAERLLAARRTVTDGAGVLARRDAQADIHDVLGRLWDTTTRPILDALGHTATPEPGRPWPRLWWCPVGVMALLPLHAAGHHHDIADGAEHPRTVMDRVVSSYTTTIRALAYARRPAESGGTTEPAGRRGAALIIAMRDTPDAPELPGADAEAGQLVCLLPKATLLRGRQATRAAVLSALPAHSVVHFACHGISNWNDPGTSQLLLYDHDTDPLTVAAISRLHADDADLAYLSACSTSDTHPRLADEAVHITAAFQLAGYRNVVGTLWPVNDRAATLIAAEVYNHLTDYGSRPPDTDDTALALHAAIRHLRAEQLATPTRWAAHMHTGC
jgi:tetratricopeptide (TPR) repeat protein